MKRRIVAIVTAIVALFVLSGCVKLDMELRLQPGDTLDGTLIFAFDKALAEMAGMSAEDMLAEAGASTSDMPPGTTVEPYDDGKYVGQQYGFTGTPISEFYDVADTGLQIVHEGDNYVVSGTFPAAEMDPSASGMEGMDFDFDMKIKVIFPGPVISANGEIDGNSVTWVPVAGTDLAMEAVGPAEGTGAGGGGSSALVWILVAVAVVAAAAAAFFVINRKKQQAAQASGYGPYPGQPFPPQPGQAFPPQPGQPYPPQPGQPYPPQPGQPTQPYQAQQYPTQPTQQYPTQPLPPASAEPPAGDAPPEPPMSPPPSA